MATRKPSSAQLAARKRFAAMARSGELAKRRRAAAKKPQRSRKQDLAIAMSEQRAGHPRKAAEFFKRAAHAKNPAKVGEATDAKIRRLAADIIQGVKAGHSFADAMHLACDGSLLSAAAKKKAEHLARAKLGYPRKLQHGHKGEVFENPRSIGKLYTVHLANPDGTPREHVAHFRRLTDAKQYAQALANARKVRVVITSKAL